MLFQHRAQGRFLLHGFAIMPDHAHVLMTPAIDQSTAKCIQFLKGGYSFAVRKQIAGTLWKDGYFARRILNSDEYRSQLQYIANNPLKKNLERYPHVHTNFIDRLDPPPEHLT